MKILYVTQEIPIPSVAGHHLRVMELLGALPDGAKVNVIGYSGTRRAGVLSSNGTTFQAIPGAVRVRRRPFKLAKAVVRSFTTNRPYSVVKFETRRMHEAISAACAKLCPDIVISSLFMLRLIPRGPWKIVLDVHNIEHKLWEGFLHRLSGPVRAFAQRESRLLRSTELDAWSKADGVIAISAEDAAEVRKACPHATVQSVPVKIEFSDSAADICKRSAKYDVGMIGVWSWPPNAIAVKDFANVVMPDLAANGMSVLIAGRGLSRKVRLQLERQGAVCPGHFAEVGDFYRAVRLIAAPFTVGGGVRMKVPEALTFERPVIGTPLAYRGILSKIPPEWCVDEPSCMAAILRRHAPAPPQVPKDVVRGHTTDDQKRALSVLLDRLESGFKAA